MIQPLSQTPGFVDPSRMHERFVEDTSAQAESNQQEAQLIDTQQAAPREVPQEEKAAARVGDSGSEGFDSDTSRPSIPDAGPPDIAVPDLGGVLLSIFGAQDEPEIVEIDEQVQLEMEQIALSGVPTPTARPEDATTQVQGGALMAILRSSLEPDKPTESPAIAAMPKQEVQAGTWAPQRVRHAQRAKGVNQSLLDVVSLAEKYLPKNFELQVGHQGGKRTQAEQDALVKKGVSRTRRSYHLTGNALDLQPIVDGKNRFDSHDMKYWGPVRDAMKRASKELGVPVEWGGDWKGSWDKPHWQIPRGWKPSPS